MEKALFSLGVLAVFGVVLALLVHNELPLVKEFVGAIAGGIVSVAALLYAKNSNDEAKRARDGAEQAKAESQSARENSEAAASEARKTERDKKRERKGKR